ncbi:MAG: YecH family protein [Candidatus Marinimicrobia bacterium]|nr:YecH family protein [Candidatus Neomarinimicrobiota bacterium]MBT3574430.1 YecH family protein [Candidatus Neomarinimicrobiota bacterium]MBT3680130.1 YecH family protein [Candidatus Neomarinimicrobiota bacterium]MBT3951372.1 YecH family protein [Candidatus Neomarinimicrobiota bacterium]MBT4253674.1 YecH family protein [Candidatus Neomarinimicrobiota bacterium]
MNTIHGHEVMHMMVNSGESYTRESLRSAIQQQFGEDTRFFTCSAQGMTADELIHFLENKGKFHPVDGGFTTAPESICNH